MRDIVVIAHNMRSTHNVGSLLRTADGLGVRNVYFTGYTPHPPHSADSRLPHETAKLARQINKTALGAEETVTWQYGPDVFAVIQNLRDQGYKIAALEQTATSTSLPEFQPPKQIAIILGREVEGLEPEVMDRCDTALEIPMFGQKESFNVVQAAAMALYHCRFAP